MTLQRHLRIKSNCQSTAHVHGFTMADKNIIINLRKIGCNLFQILPHRIARNAQSIGGFRDVVAVFLTYMHDMEAHGFIQIVWNSIFHLRMKAGVDFNMLTDELLVCSMPRPKPSSATEQSSYSSRVATFLQMVVCKAISRHYLNNWSRASQGVRF